MIRYALFRVFLYLLPAILISYAEGHLGFSFFSDETKEKKFEGVIYFVGLGMTICIFPYLYEMQRKKLKYQNDILVKNFKFFRQYLNNALSEQFKTGDLYLNIRIFLPKKGILPFFSKLFWGRRYFQMHNFAGLYIDDVSNLVFQVAPKCEGLIGQCYRDKKIWHDFKLSINHSNPMYGLSDSQKQKTEYCKIAIAAPIFNDKNEIDAIIAFDSKVQVNQPQDDNWINLIKESCVIIHLCKPLITHKNLDYEPE